MNKTLMEGGALGVAQTEAVVDQLYQRVSEGTLFVRNTWIEVAVIAVAVVAGLLVDRLVHGWVARHGEDRSAGTKLRQRLWRYLLQLPGRLATPVTILVCLAVCADLCRRFGWTGGMETMPVTRIAYTLSAVLAIARLGAYVIKGFLGDRIWLQDTAVSWFVWSMFLLQILGVLPWAVDLLKAAELPMSGYNLSLWECLVSMAGITVTLGVAKWASDLFSEWLQDARFEAVDGNLRIVLGRLATFVLYGIAVLTALSMAGVDLKILSVFGGALGVGLGFGLQKIASNYVSGFIVLLEKSVKIGDLVQVGSTAGVISKIATRYSIIRAVNGVETVVPNEMLVTSPVINRNLSGKRTRLTVDGSVAYGSDYRKALAVMVECAAAQPRVVKDPMPTAVITSMGDSEVCLQVGMWIEDAENGTGSLTSAIRQAILERFDQEGLEIPFPQLDVHVTGTDKAAV